MNGDAGYPRWQIGEQWKSRLCPRKVVTEESWEWIQLYSAYRAGHLAFAGGILDQPAIYITAMTLIDSFKQQATSND